MAVIQHLGTKDKPYAGTSGKDVLEGSAGGDYLYGAGGHDELYGRDGNDELVAGQVWNGSAWVDDHDGDLLDGGAGNDLLIGGAGSDQLFGGEGDDRLTTGQIWIDGKWVNDTTGDLLDGGGGNDEMIGADGNDTILGGSGNDTLYGNPGDDTLDGGSGTDLLYGGPGDDRYVVRDRNTLVVDREGKNSGTIMADWVKPAQNVEWTWGPGVQKLPYWIDALGFDRLGAIGSALDAQHTVYYSFAQTTASWFTDADKNQFSPFNAAQQAVVAKVLDYIGSVVNIKFVPTTDADKPNSIVFGNNEQASSGGYASAIRPDHGAALMVDYHALSQDPARDDGQALTMLLLHEIGHSLYLKHPFGHKDANGDVGQGPFLPEGEELKSLTVMSYTYDAASAGQVTYSPLDLAALHYAYGVAAAARAGDDRYVLSDARTNMLWDGNGLDTVDGSALAKDLVLDLRPGYWGYIGQKADIISAAGQVTVNFGTVLEAALGGKGNDKLTGNEAPNSLAGGDGNDVLAGREGDDNLQGGAGIDTAFYAGKRADYSVVRSGLDATVSDSRGVDGKDSLSGVERIQFADTMLALDADGINAQVFRLYQAAYDRKPDLAGLGYWIGMAEKGVGLKEIAAAFTGGTEFATLYGAKADDAAFLTKLYANVLHRPYDQGGYDFWLNALKAGISRDDVLIEFADSKENVANVATLIANGIEYLPFA